MPHKTRIENILITVVHIVVDWVQAWLIWTGVTASWTSTGGGELRRSVRNLIATSCTGISLERVKETEPMTDFVGYGLSLVVVGGRTAWNSAVKDGATISLESMSIGDEIRVTFQLTIKVLEPDVVVVGK